MNLIDEAARNKAESIYYGAIDLFSKLYMLIPYGRRALRFAALPYCFFYQVEWSKCYRSRLGVLRDMLYIFFVLKYYPDNYFLCRLWEVDRKLWKYYYGSIYDPYQRKKLQEHIYSRENIVLFENKLVCYELCKAAGFPVPRQHGVIYPGESYKNAIRSFLKDTRDKKVIIKPVDGMGGKGIVVAYLAGEQVMVKKKEKSCSLAQFNLNHPAVLQEYINQHEQMAQFSSSANTVRLATLLKKDQSDVLIIGAFVRFGTGAADVDNLSSGGVASGVDVETGMVYEQALDFRGESYSCHPSSGIPFRGFIIPHWEQVVALSKSVQFHFNYHRLLGLDVCITEHGPVLIEINAELDMVALEMTSGPILLRDEVLEEFCRYDILINKPSKDAAQPGAYAVCRGAGGGEGIAKRPR